MSFSVADLDQLLQYHPETHSVGTFPTIRQPVTPATGADVGAMAQAKPQPASHIPSVDSGAPPVPQSSGIPSVSSYTPPNLSAPKESTWQKIGHGFEKAGEIAGNAFVPGVMANIPGTQINKEFQQQRQSNLAAKQAQTGLENAEAWKDIHPNPTTPFESYEVGNPNRAQDWVNYNAEAGKTPDERTYQDLINQGKSPQEALATVNKGKVGQTPAEQTYSDLLKKGTSPEDAFTAVSKPPADSAAQDTARAEKIRQAQILGQAVSPEDAAWLKAHVGEKTAVPQFTVDNRAEQGNYLPVPDPSDPLHKIIGWVDPKSGHFRSLQDIKMGPGGTPMSGDIKPTGQEASREGQAQVVLRAADGLTKDIEANKDKLGNVEAILKSAFLSTPLADKDLSGLATEIASFAALQPAMHGFRGQQAMDEFVKIIGGVPKNADALLSSIAAIKKTAGYFDPSKPAAPSNEPTRPGNVPGNFEWNSNGPKGAGWYRPKQQ